MTDAPKLRATEGASRLAVLDALRGFALCGVFLANIIYWSKPLAVNLPDFPARTTDEMAALWEFTYTAFVEGKFYSIFSLLFGLGFSLQLHRLQQRRADGVAIFRRRLLILLLIGLFHMQFIWEGDILTLYALLGLTLPWLAACSDRRLLITAGLLLFLPLPLVALQHLLGLPPSLAVERAGAAIFDALTDVPEPVDDAGALPLWASGSWETFIAWQASSPPYRLSILITEWRPFKVLAMMLIGLVAGRHVVEGTLLDNRGLLKKIAIIGLGIGLPASVAYGLTGGLRYDDFEAHFLSFLIYAVSVAPLALGYAALFVLAWPRFHSLLGTFSPLGRMALTNYLAQSVLGTLIFWGVFGGLVGRLGPWETWGVAVLILVVQILVSRWWLQHHDQGPLEKLWRLATYRAR